MRRAGYTLIELLLVLFVVTSFVLLPTLAIDSWQTKLNRNLFYDRVEKNILHTQQLAITTMKSSKIQTYRKEQIIEFDVAGEPSSRKTLKLPSGVSLKMNNCTIRFNGVTGNMGSFNSGNKLVFQDQELGQVTYQFQMGSGRFEKK